MINDINWSHHMDCLLLLEWEDSTSYSGWHSREDLPNLVSDGFVRGFKSIGWLVHHDADGIVIAQSKNMEKVGELLYLPHSAIRKVSAVYE